TKTVVLGSLEPYEAELEQGLGCSAGTLDGSGVTGDDPLVQYQWFLSNTGQKAFGSCPGVLGNDLSYGSLTSPAYTGSGHTIVVVDTGLDMGHEDLTANISSTPSYNFLTGSTTDLNSDDTEGHGTAVAGILAAPINGIGVQGVAPSAKLVGYNAINASVPAANQQNDIFWALTGGHFPTTPASPFTITAPQDIYNLSWGEDINQSVPWADVQTDETAYSYGISNGRGGSGSIYVKAAGNGFFQLTNAGCGISVAANLPCQNANMDFENTLPELIVVASTNANGVRSSYSSPGSAVWVSGIGGEFGENSASTYAPSLIDLAYMPAIVTTDQTGCSMGFSAPLKNTPNNPFDAGPNSTIGNTLNSNCNYTSSMNGTSSATPTVAGTVALLLQANSSLTWRDVKHILATTATQVQRTSANPPVMAPVTVLLGNGAYVAEPGWVLNTAGHYFHNWYGFGRVNVSLATSTAATYTANSLGTQKDTGFIYDSGALSLAIPDNSTVGASKSITVSGSGITFIEAVQVRVSATHPYPGDLGVELTSPGGTRSVLLNIRNGLESSANLTDMPLLTNAFYGEPAAGTWTLKVVDGNAKDTGTLTDWKLRILGH
ncbi:MAG: S8 family peptidase, partial [SAR324 cluster bacterium]